MKLRLFVTVTAIGILSFGARHVGAQPLPPQQMMGAYAPVAPMAYPMPYAPAVPAGYDVRQDAAVPAAASAVPCGEGTCPECACGDPCWCHKVAVYGEFLYLQARNSEVAYGVPIDGPIVAPPTANPIQVGRMGVVDQDYDPAFRLGFNYVLDGCSSIGGQYTYFESTRTDEITTTAPNVIRSLVSHPGTLTAAQDFLSAQASHDIEFQFLDVDYRRVLSCGGDHNLSFLVGVRAGEFSQDFAADFVATGTESVRSEIDFYGAGIRLGLEGERYSMSRRWLIYGKTYGNLIAGDFTADYLQTQSFDPEVVNTTWKAGRIVPMLDLEVGAGWQSRCGTWRLTGGYMISAWYNTVKTDEWIAAVRNNDFVGLSGNMSFDGLVLRCEGRF
ncbi:MAG: Lpg1974 family pore-forming outer membrane protein [Pirellulaceae bacterium]|nr:Lpg1974 family pore-forming outer membrane protein [Pirellulaceae bacterium]